MSEFDFEDVKAPDGLLEVKYDDNSKDAYIDDCLQVIDGKLLKTLAKKLGYSDSFHSHAWKHDVFVEVGWRKFI